MTESVHPTLLKKRLAKLRKLTRLTPRRFIDLVDYLQTRGYCNTAGAARELLIDGRVTYESHIVGREKVPYQTPDGKTKYEWAVAPRVPAEYREKLYVRTS